MPAHVQWENVDGLVFVAPHIRDFLCQAIPDLAQRTRIYILPNGVDMDRFILKRDTTSTGRIAFAATFRPVKNLPLMLQCFHALQRQDPSRTLHCAGSFVGTQQDVRELTSYLQHMILTFGLGGKVFFEGYIQDMNAWLEDKEFMLSTSIRESFGFNIAEAMAKGIRPLIHNFPDARSAFSLQLLFNTIEECCAIAAAPGPRPRLLRQFINEHYSLSAQMQALATIINDISPTGARSWLFRTARPFIRPQLPKNPRAQTGQAWQKGISVFGEFMKNQASGG